MDTICALSTAPGRAGIAVIRVSGPEAFGMAGMLAGTVPKPGRHGVRILRASDGSVLDDALVLTFAGPASFTGEDVVELQVHGSPAVTAAVLDQLVRHGARPAEAGEFTRRALENDRLGVDEVEGLSDLLAAETKAQMDQAQRVRSGELGALIESLRARLLRAAALLEAMIDFADEEVPEDTTAEVLALTGAVRSDIRAEIDGSYVAERVRDGFEIAIIGVPNAGKSTLINALAGREAVLVSDIAGTTRDVVELRMDLRGLAVTWLDTAGLRHTEDRVEQMGVAMAKARADAADLRVFLLTEAGEAPSIEPLPDDLVLVGKADQGGGDISGATGEGIDDLLSHVHQVLSARVARIGSSTNLRHRTALELADTALADAELVTASGLDRIDLAAENFRLAIRRLDVLMGRIDVEAILGEVFSSFCIGK